MRTTRVFDITSSAWLKKPRYISSCGGTRSGKTFSIIQLLYLQCLGEERRNAPPTINSIVSESMPHLKRGAIRDFKTILQGEGIWSDEKWSETDKYYRFSNGSIIEFFSIDNAGKVYGSARDNLFINECQHIDYEIARQLFVRTRGRIILDYNPTNHFWVMDKIECKDNCIRVHSTYKDNGFLTPEQVREIEDNQDDKNWWKVFGEGKEGTLDGLIYDFEQIDHMPPKDSDKPQAQKTAEELYADSLQEIQGLDFGFTNDPTARVQVFADPKRKHAYIRERCYRTHMQNKHIIEDLKEDNVGRRVEIFADCAEPKSIQDIIDGGFNVTACDKDAPVKSDKLKFQIQWMQGWKFFVTKDSLNLIEELRNYTWAKDKDGNLLNQPIDKFNHSLDALRYALWTKYGKNAGQGQYSISFNRKGHGKNSHH